MVDDALAALDAHEPARRNVGLATFTDLYGSDWTRLAPKTTIALGELGTRAHDLARGGDLAALRAFQSAATGRYATSAEGGETFGEDLWELLEVQTQMSLDALASQPEGIRDELMRLHYRAPIHDLFDFPTIVDALDRCSPPITIAREAEAIRAVAWEMLETFGATPEGFQAWREARAAERMDPPGLEEASRRYLEAIQRSPQWADPHRRLGETYGRLGRYREAASHLRRYLELSAGMPPWVTGEVEARIAEFQAAENR
ncbi:MAG: hypothetical protein R3344_10045 [Acidobacteriota bacterium]|nr:hypothetical protein [Acidobacteriota bacterium]